MMANITMAKNRSSPICNKGTMAFMMDLRTTCRPVGTQKHLREGRKMGNGEGLGERDCPRDKDGKYQAMLLFPGL